MRLVVAFVSGVVTAFVAWVILGTDHSDIGKGWRE